MRADGEANSERCERRTHRHAVVASLFKISQPIGQRVQNRGFEVTCSESLKPKRAGRTTNGLI